MRGHAARSYRLLLVEDNPCDVEMVREALGTFLERNSMVAVDNVADALRHLRERDDEALPDLILLDFNLPGLTGKDFLAAAKRDAVLRRIPVLVFTTSRSEHDVEDAYGLHANGYVTKPMDLDEFIRVMGDIRRFWLGIVQLPTQVKYL